MNEHSLHSEIKKVYSLPNDAFEVKLGNYVIDILRGNLVIEVQTKNFSAIKNKLQTLTKTNKVRLVYPLPEKKWIIQVDKNAKILSKRKSPRKGKLTDIFKELVKIPHMLNEDNFSLEVLFVDEEEVRCNDGKGSWRRRGISIKERRLIKVNNQLLFQNKQDYLKILPENLNDSFTNKDLAKIAKIPVGVARQITYCFRISGFIQVAEKKGRALIFKICR